MSTESLIREAKAFHLKKHLGQHFLVDPDVLNTIVSSLDAHAGETVLEVGPGIGFLTRLLVQTGARVVAVELDRETLTHLRDMPLPNFEVKHGDILQFDLRALEFFKKKNAAARAVSEVMEPPTESKPSVPQSGSESAAEPGEPIAVPAEPTAAPASEPHRLKVVGNVPYQITGLIIGHLLGEIGAPSRWVDLIDTIVLTVQREVARRMVASAGDDDYSKVSLLVEYFCDAQLVTEIPPDAFFPPPQVHSAVVKLVPRRSSPVSCNNPVLLRQLIEAGFLQRRKMFRNSLGFLKLAQSDIDGVFKRLSFDPQARAERLSLTQFAMLADAFDGILKSHGNNGHGASSGENQSHV